MSDVEYARLLAAQGGHCALCPNRPKSRRLDVDHDHATGLVRGLLCHACNRRLWQGCTRAWLLRAADYVDRPPARRRAHVEHVQWLLAQEFPAGTTGRAP